MDGIKLTTQDNKTRPGYENETLWGPGVRHEAPGTGPLCTAGWIHFYRTAAEAVFMNPVHGHYTKGWKCIAAGTLRPDGTKWGAEILTTTEEVPLPTMTPAMATEVVIRTAMLVYGEPTWSEWARNWLNGTDRGITAAQLAQRNTDSAARANPCALPAINYWVAARAASYAAMTAIHGSLEEHWPSVAAATVADAADASGDTQAECLEFENQFLKILHDVLSKQTEKRTE